MKVPFSVTLENLELFGKIWKKVRYYEWRKCAIMSKESMLLWVKKVCYYEWTGKTVICGQEDRKSQSPSIARVNTSDAVTPSKQLMNSFMWDALEVSFFATFMWDALEVSFFATFM